MKGMVAYSQEVWEYIAEERGDVDLQFNINNPEHREIYENYINNKEVDGLNLFDPESLNEFYGGNEYIYNDNYKSNPKVLADLMVCARNDAKFGASFRSSARKLVNEGVDVYAAKAILLKTFRNTDCVEFFQRAEGANATSRVVDNDPVFKKTVASFMMAYDELEDMESPYESIFLQMQNIVEREREIKQRDNKGMDVAHTQYLEEELSKIKAGLQSQMKNFDPFMLERVAKSKQDLEVEAQIMDAGYKDMREQRGKTFNKNESFMVKNTTEYGASMKVAQMARQMQKEMTTMFS